MAKERNKALGNNPLDGLFGQEEPKTILSEADVATILEEQHKNSVTHEWTTATFKVRREYMKKLRDYAYTERIEIKVALDQALEMFLSDKTDLLEAPEKPITTRKRDK